MVYDDGLAQTGGPSRLRHGGKVIDIEQHLAVTLASIGAGFIAADSNSRVTHLNSVAERVSGWSEAEARGRALSDMLVREEVPGEFSPLNLVDWAIEQRATIDTPLRFVVLARGGARTPIELRPDLLRADDGSVRGIALVFRIATNMPSPTPAEPPRQISECLAVEKQQIQEAYRLKSQFLANMSHELRTPLNAIIGFSDLLYSGTIPPGSPKYRSFLTRVGASGRLLLLLVDDLIDLSRLEAGNFEFFPVAVRLTELALEVVNDLRVSLGGKSPRLAVDIDPTLTDLWLDAECLARVLRNCLTTAVKFTANRGEVTVRGRSEGQAHLRIEVEAAGAELGQEALLRLFNEFRQSDAAFNKQHDRSDLGMLLARRLIEAQGGAVGVRQDPGNACTFHFVLKRVQGAELDSPDD